MATPSGTLQTLLGGLHDRWTKGQSTALDAQALVRVVIIEARLNQTLLEIALDPAESLPPAALWELPSLLQTAALGAVLGQGATATRAYFAVRRLKPTDAPAGPEAADILTQLYLRVTALQALASLPRRGDLKRVHLKSRLVALRTDFARVVAVLARDVRK